EAGCIPYLVGKVAARLHTLPVETHVISRRISCHQCQTQGIRAVLIDHFQRIDAVSEGFAHLSSLGISHKAVDQYVVERNLTGLLQSGEHHTHYPERDNIITRYQNIRRIEIFQFRRLLRPSQCGKRPQSGTEPGVQSIRILGEMGVSAFRADCRSAASLYDQLPALVTGISRDPMSPPQLSGDTPVTDIFQPVEIRFFKTLRNKVCFSALYRLDRRFSHIRHLYEPLGFYHRLDRRLTAVMGSYVVNMILYFYEKSLCLKIRNHCL